MMMMMIMTGEVERREAGQRSLGNCCKKTSAERQSAPQVLVITILIRTIMMESIHRDAPPLRHCFVWGYLGFPMQLKNNFLHPVLLGHHHFHHQLFPGCRQTDSLSKSCFRVLFNKNPKWKTNRRLEIFDMEFTNAEFTQFSLSVVLIRVVEFRWKHKD